jgi:alpha-galactosidase
MDTDIDSLDLTHVIQGWESPKARRSVTGAQLSIAGKTFDRGVGTHTDGWMGIACSGDAIAFRAVVGIDDAVGRHGWGAARFRLVGDGREIADSGVVRGGEPGRMITADLTGIQMLELLCEAPHGSTHHGHADWCDACITSHALPPRAAPRPRGLPVHRRPAAERGPRFVAGWMAGAMPGAPFLWTIPCLGDDLRLAAENLPAGLVLDPVRGIISGVAPPLGRHPVLLRAENQHGAAQRVMNICSGESCPVPPMGWASWNSCHAAIDAQRIAEQADALVRHGLHRHGYQRINIDDGWQGTRIEGQALQPMSSFGDMAGLTARLRSLGLIPGIYHVPTVHSPQGLAGATADAADGSVATAFVHGGANRIGAHRFTHQDVAQFAAWGIDYLKLDEGPSPAEAAIWAAAIRATGRNMLLSLSAGRPRAIIDDYRPSAQVWRTTSDLIDTWFSVRSKLRQQAAWQGVGRANGWNDADMLVVGEVGPGWNAPLQPTRLAYEEQYLHVGMWAFLASPLLIGADLTRLDPFTLQLLANPAVIELNQDPLAAPAVLVSVDDERGVMRWQRPLHDGAIAVALVNLGDRPADIEVGELPGRASDIWTGEDLGPARGRRLCLEPRSHRLIRTTP